MIHYTKIYLTFLALTFFIVHLPIFAFDVGFGLLGFFFGCLCQNYGWLWKGLLILLGVTAALGSGLRNSPTLGLTVRGNVITCHVSAS
jgi:uncharacterized membrane protein YccC